MKVDDLSRLVAIEAIKTLKARYFRFVDTKDWNALRALFTDDAVLEFPENFDTPFTADSFIDMVQSALPKAISIHHGHMPEIEILSDTDARGIWAMDDIVIFPPGDPGLTGAAEITGAGHYHETYRRIGGEWRIATLRITRLRLQTLGSVRTVA